MNILRPAAKRVTTSGGTPSYTEGGAAAAVDALLSLADDDDANLEGATLTISGGFALCHYPLTHGKPVGHPGPSQILDQRLTA